MMLLAQIPVFFPTGKFKSLCILFSIPKCLMFTNINTHIVSARSLPWGGNEENGWVQGGGGILMGGRIPFCSSGEGVLNVNGHTFNIGRNYYIFSRQWRSTLYPSI